MILELDKENLELSKYEAEALFDRGKLINNFLILNCSNPSRLALTKNYYNILFESSEKNLENTLKKFKFNKFVGRFSFRSIDKKLEKKLGRLFVEKLQDSDFEVFLDLKNPDKEFVLLKLDKYYFTEKETIKKRQENISKRPGFLPISLKPKLARVLINLTGSKTKIIDPFCGTGGILIEASLLNLYWEGYDIDPKMIEFSKKNIEYYSLNGKLKVFNSLKLKKKIDYIVTDMPYGKNTKQKEYKKIIQDFLDLLPKILKKRAVVVIPDMKVKTSLKKKEFKVYIHKSLTKKILILESSLQ